MDPTYDVRLSSEEEINKNRELKSLQILDAELNSLKKNAKVYVRQPNSQILFLADIEEVRTDTKAKLIELSGE